MPEEWTRGAFTISTDPGRLNIDAIHQYLSGVSYWATGRPLEVLCRGIENSLPFGIFKGSEQAGFARVITDYATFAWLADVFVLPAFQKQGLGKWLLEVIVQHPQLQGLRRWGLVTKDAHGLYKQYGFKELRSPEQFMERLSAQ